MGFDSMRNNFLYCGVATFTQHLFLSSISWWRCTARTATAGRCGLLVERQPEMCVTCWSRRLTAAMRRTGLSWSSIPPWAWVPLCFTIKSNKTETLTKGCIIKCSPVSSERCLEDHEVVLEVQATWSLKGDTRFVFCKNYAKYEFFRKPVVS